MLDHLRIRCLGVINDAELEFSPGFTAITGETGAGKTMVVTGLGLLLGGRPDGGRVRAGSRTAVVEGRVEGPPGHPAFARAEEAGAELDDGALLLSRTVSAEGRSRAYCGGRSVPAAVLGELAEELVAVHGQNDQRRLLQPSRQRQALDRFAGAAVQEPLGRYSSGYTRLRELVAELDELRAQRRERAREADLLRFGLAEIEAADPQPGEEDELAREDSRLAHADALRTAAVAAHAALLGDPDSDGVDASGLVAVARRSVEQMREHDPTLADLGERLSEVAYLLNDVAADLASYAAGIDTDPARLAFVQERRAGLSALFRKYGDSSVEVLDWARRGSARLLELESDDDRGLALEGRIADLRRSLAVDACALSVARRAAASELAAAVTAELAALAMPHARVTVELRQSDDLDGLDITCSADGPVADHCDVGDHCDVDDHCDTASTRALAFGPAGVDDVEILLTPHPGAAPSPLNRGASGGELSRVMLALEVVFAGIDPVPTFVFDEVDAGVGGKAAVEIGRRLARLAAHAQVIVVTHLPQVAAFADRHLQVVKSSDGLVTSTGVATLDEGARVTELSRMLAGLEGSQTAMAHAEELLATARAERTSSKRPPKQRPRARRPARAGTLAPGPS